MSKELIVALLGVVAALIGFVAALLGRLKRHEVHVRHDAQQPPPQQEVIGAVLSHERVPQKEPERAQPAASENVTTPTTLADRVIGEWKAVKPGGKVRGLVLRADGTCSLCYCLPVSKSETTNEGHYKLGGDYLFLTVRAYYLRMDEKNWEDYEWQIEVLSCTESKLRMVADSTYVRWGGRDPVEQELVRVKSKNAEPGAAPDRGLKAGRGR